MVTIERVGFGSTEFCLWVRVTCPNCDDDLLLKEGHNDKSVLFKCQNCKNRFTIGIETMSSEKLPEPKKKRKAKKKPA